MRLPIDLEIAKEARSRAFKEADERGLKAAPDAPYALSEQEKFISKREAEIYAELEKIA